MASSKWSRVGDGAHRCSFPGEKASIDARELARRVPAECVVRSVSLCRERESRCPHHVELDVVDTLRAAVIATAVLHDRRRSVDVVRHLLEKLVEARIENAR